MTEHNVSQLGWDSRSDVPAALTQPSDLSCLTADLLAADIMIRQPKVLAADALVGDVRVQLRDDHVHMALLTEGGRLVGTLVAADLSPGLDDMAPALPFARLDARTVPSTHPAREVYIQLRSQGQRRLAVTTEDGTLVGLICLKRHLSGFCADHDVDARAAGLVRRRKDEPPSSPLVP